MGTAAPRQAFTRKENSVPLPLPVIGVRAAWAFAPQWVLEGQGQVFKADVDGYDGRITDLRAGVTWMFSRNFGAGVGYNRFVTTVETRRRSSTDGCAWATRASSCT